MAIFFHDAVTTHRSKSLYRCVVSSHIRNAISSPWCPVVENWKRNMSSKRMGQQNLFSMIVGVEGRHGWPLTQPTATPMALSPVSYPLTTGLSQCYHAGVCLSHTGSESILPCKDLFEPRVMSQRVWNTKLRRTAISKTLPES